MGSAEQLKNQLDIVDVVGQYVRLKRVGTHHVGLSPFRNERTPSFAVYSDHWHDFGSGEHGDVIDFIQRIENLTFPEAVRILAERYGIPVDASAKRPARPRHSEETLSLAYQLIVGLRWRIDRNLEVLKLQLYGSRHEQVAPAIKTLTSWKARIDGCTALWLNGPPKDPRSYWEVVWRGRRQQDEAVELLKKLSWKVARECIAEAAEANKVLAEAISGQKVERAA